jgi:hypothetical protein
MEESENWRRHLLWFMRLEECKFAKAVGQQIDQSTILVTFKRIKIVASAAADGRGGNGQ